MPIGSIKKLYGQLNSPIDYSLPLGEEKIPLNDLIGKKISLRFEQEIYCIQCARKTTKSFQQGYCYPCYRKLMDCNLCIIHPERCNFPKKDCPDTWEHAHCKEEQIVYLANSSGLKVGITRASQIPTRWIDQGACQAIPLFKVRNRYEAGVIEVSLKGYIADKTNWRKMLSDNLNTYDMNVAKAELMQQADSVLHHLYSAYQGIKPLNEEALTLTYPINEYPQKLTLLSFDKNPFVSGILLGIKGQYLLLNLGIINIRKHAGYVVSMTF